LAVAGIIGALVAAAPGLIDYLHSVPPKSSAKQRATKHLAVNLTGVALVAVATLVRPESSLPPDFLTLALEAIAVGLITAGGWMGGTLVNRNQIGVDHRYAHAGKWQETQLHASDGEHLEIARTDEMEIDQMKLVRVDDVRIVVARTEDGFVAFEDRCTHRGASLADGVMICGTVQCPWHGSQFDVRTGAVKAGPAEQAIETYGIEQVGGSVRLVITQSEAAGAARK
jgi:nitrite reductase/ring-hydroxylating ferredoxin subunit